MSALVEAQTSGIWLERSNVEEAECRYQEYLVRGSAVKGVDPEVVSKVDKSLYSMIILILNNINNSLQYLASFSFLF